MRSGGPPVELLPQYSAVSAKRGRGFNKVRKILHCATNCRHLSAILFDAAVILRAARSRKLEDCVVCACAEGTASIAARYFSIQASLISL